MAGLALAALTYFPLFQALTAAANPALAQAQQNSRAVIIADPATCAFQFNPVGTASFTSECDRARGALARASVSYATEPAPSGARATIKIGSETIEGFDAAKVSAAIKAAGYPAAADPAAMNTPLVLLILTLLVIYVTMVYAPIAAMLVELFPTRIRYTSLSLPYHIGNGWFGGFLPSVSFALVAGSGDIYFGLWYPIMIAASSLVIGLLFLPETKGRDLTV